MEQHGGSRPTSEHEHDGDEHHGSGEKHMNKMYLRFLAMIATATVVMFALTYVNTYAFAHIRFSETRVYMAILMGGAMVIVMLSFMLGMYKDLKTNIALVLGGLLLITTGTVLVRTQTLVQDRSFMRAMTPHHSIAILTSEHSEISDVRVCELAVRISETQRKEIAEMDWLIDDISENGPATIPEEAEARPVPDFDGTALRECP